MENSAVDETAAVPENHAGPPPSSANTNGYFDCNICLDFTRDPVVTLCGHLYCSPCINKWLLVEDDNISPQSCPVCKASLSHDSLVHLYGRGSLADRRKHRGFRDSPARRRGYDGGEILLSAAAFSRPRMMGLADGGVLGGMEVAAAMTGGLYYSRRYHGDEGSAGGRRRRRREMEVARWLNQIWMFMLCSAILCLLLF